MMGMSSLAPWRTMLSLGEIEHFLGLFLSVTLVKKTSLQLLRREVTIQHQDGPRRSSVYQLVYISARPYERKNQTEHSKPIYTENPRQSMIGLAKITDLVFFSKNPSRVTIRRD
uniref:Uncharacterized protein n=1 Tax=Leersia perrieri TaxID=77586 RepID=A0A0D9V2P4_9ORYZ